MLGWLPNAAAVALPPSSGEGALQAGRLEQGSSSGLNLSQSVDDKYKCNARRSVAILKLPRTGSTWLVHALNSTGKWCHVVDEATNVVFTDTAWNEATNDCYDAGVKVEEALACPGHPAMHGGLSINPLKYLSATPPETFLSLRLTEHPEDNRQIRERYVRAFEGIGWAPGHIGYNDTWNTSVWVGDAPGYPDAHTEAVAHSGRGLAQGGMKLYPNRMKCRDEEVGAMASASPPRLITLLRSNFVQQAASLIRALALSLTLSSCDGWHPERCHTEADQALLKQKLPVSPEDMLAQAEVLEHAAATVRRVASEIAEELSTSLHHTTYEELAATGGGEGMALPRDVEEYLGLEHLGYTINVTTEHRESHATWDEGPRLSADIANFGELRAYFEKHATPKQLRMLME